jgi:hypothetical protein
MADEASTAGQALTERGAAEPPPPAALTRKCDEDTKAQMDVVAETLTAHGFDVRGPDWEDSRLLKVMGLRDATCEITVEDSGFLTWEYHPGAGDGIDPDKITGRVMRLLTSGERPRWHGRAAPGAGLKGLVGCRLKTMGLVLQGQLGPVAREGPGHGGDWPTVGTASSQVADGCVPVVLGVCLDVYEDHDTYEVVAEIIVTNPGRPERGQVRVSDDGALMWECGYEEDLINTATIANMMATILTGDIADGCVQRGELAMAGPTGRAIGRVSLVGG